MQKHQPFTTLTHVDNLEQTAQKLIQYAGPCKIWLFRGELGAGKTTLIKAICRQLSVVDHVTSPTFSLINMYYLASGGILYHMDGYRLTNEEEAIDMDYPYYFKTGTYCFIEWPDKIYASIPVPHISIELGFDGGSEYRKLHAHRVDKIDKILDI